jgi:hypothetical protein
MRCWNSSREAHEVCSLCKYYSGCCFRQQNLSLLVCRSKIPFKVVETWYTSKRVKRQLILGFSIWDAYNTQRKACLLLVLRLIFGKCSWMKMTLYKSFCGWYLQQLMAEHLREWVLDYTIHSGCQSQNASFGQKTQSSFENLFSLVIDGATLVPDAYKWMSSCNTPSLSTKGVTVYIRFCQIIWVTGHRSGITVIIHCKSFAPWFGNTCLANNIYSLCRCRLWMFLLCAFPVHHKQPATAVNTSGTGSTNSLHSKLQYKLFWLF